MDTKIKTVTAEYLRHKLQNGPPDNERRTGGYTVVNVLDEEHYQKEHIPHSINIPAQKMEDFEQKFDRDKEIIVYCASFDCQASAKVAAKLMERGFTSVSDFEAGMVGWKEAGYEYESSSAIRDYIQNGSTRSTHP